MNHFERKTNEKSEEMKMRKNKGKNNLFTVIFMNHFEWKISGYTRESTSMEKICY